MLPDFINHKSNTDQDTERKVSMLRLVTGTPKKRMVVKRGKEYILLRTEEVVLIYTEDKIVYVADQAGKRYMHEKNLSEIMEELDEQMFFRANRQYILNIGFIKSFKAYEKVKLQISLTVQELGYHAIIISQETAPLFRKWIGG